MITIKFTQVGNDLHLDNDAPIQFSRNTPVQVTLSDDTFTSAETLLLLFAPDDGRLRKPATVPLARSGSVCTGVIGKVATMLQGVTLVSLGGITSGRTITSIAERIDIPRSLDPEAGALAEPATLSEVIDSSVDRWLNNSDSIQNTISAGVDAWLDDHPEATTSVQDGSLTSKKLIAGTMGYVTPEQFGAVGNGNTDDAQAFRDAITYAKEHKCKIAIDNKNYYFAAHVITDGKYIASDSGIYAGKPFIYSHKISNSMLPHKMWKMLNYAEIVGVSGFYFQSATYIPDTDTVLLGFNNSDDTQSLLVSMNGTMTNVTGRYNGNLGHCNDLTYNSKTKRIYVACGTSGIAVLDTSYAHIDTIPGFCGQISYDEKNDMFYTMGKSAIQMRDSDLNVIAEFPIIEYGNAILPNINSVWQGSLVVDGQYICITQVQNEDNKPAASRLSTIDYDSCTISAYYDFPVITPNREEVEAAFEKDGICYLLSYNSDNLIVQQINFGSKHYTDAYPEITVGRFTWKPKLLNDETGEEIPATYEHAIGYWYKIERLCYVSIRIKTTSINATGIRAAVSLPFAPEKGDMLHFLPIGCCVNATTESVYTSAQVNSELGSPWAKLLSASTFGAGVAEWKSTDGVSRIQLSGCYIAAE